MPLFLFPSEEAIPHHQMLTSDRPHRAQLPFLSELSQTHLPTDPQALSTCLWGYQTAEHALQRVWVACGETLQQHLRGLCCAGMEQGGRRK